MRHIFETQLQMGMLQMVNVNESSVVDVSEYVVNDVNTNFITRRRA